jgi:hypothetical protein
MLRLSTICWGADCTGFAVTAVEAGVEAGSAVASGVVAADCVAEQLVSSTLKLSKPERRGEYIRKWRLENWVG